MGFCKLWAKIVWKMRSVYCSLAVHVFDVLTDILVILSWLYYPDVEGDGIDPRVMAYSAMIVLLFHKLVSIIAFWSKEKSIIRCILQFLDLLIFEEIYLTHQRIVSQFKNKSNPDYADDNKAEDSIETTQTFKFVRNLEAVFEAIPQSVLQLVFIIRTGWQSEGSGIFLFISVASIIQSIISMTNSILKNDNIYMTLPKWKKHKKRLPPTWQFMKHFIARLSEVIYRISLCALFWTVCGGEAFGALIAFELILVIGMTIVWDFSQNYEIWNSNDTILRIQALIVMPSELVYASHAREMQLPNDVFGKSECGIALFGFGCFGTCCGVCTCCTGPAVLLSTCCLCRKDYYIHMTIRIGLSMLEWCIIVVCAYFLPDSYDYLFSFDHGLYVFIVSITCYLIYTQYLYLFPNFELPYGIPIRSIYGYAFNGELEELQRTEPQKMKSSDLFHWNDDDPSSSSSPPFSSREENYREAFYGRSTRIGRFDDVDDPPSRYENSHMTLTMLALSNKQYETVEILESKGATKHLKLYNGQYEFENMDHLFARRYIQISDWPESELWNKPYGLSACGTCYMLALSMKQYHVVDWLVQEKKVKVPTILFERQNKYDTMDYEFAREYIGQDFFEE